MIVSDWKKLKEIRNDLKSKNKKVVFTNGCFDILHIGHVEYLIKAKSFGDILIVAINSDDSVKKIKGEKRPIIPQQQRAFLIDNLKVVDYVTFFSEETPFQIISTLIPDVLVKGADWELENIVGAKLVTENGGSVKRIEFNTNQSTTNIINQIIRKYSA